MPTKYDWNDVFFLASKYQRFSLVIFSTYSTIVFMTVSKSFQFPAVCTMDDKKFREICHLNKKIEIHFHFGQCQRPRLSKLLQPKTMQCQRICRNRVGIHTHTHLMKMLVKIKLKWTTNCMAHMEARNKRPTNQLLDENSKCFFFCVPAIPMHCH